MTLEFGDPDSRTESGSPFSYQGPYSRFLVRMACDNPQRWIVMERQRVPARGIERQVAVRRMSGRACNVKRHARIVGKCIDVATRVVGNTATTYVRGDAG